MAAVVEGDCANAGANEEDSGDDEAMHYDIRCLLLF